MGAASGPEALHRRQQFVAGSHQKLVGRHQWREDEAPAARIDEAAHLLQAVCGTAEQTVFAGRLVEGAGVDHLEELCCLTVANVVVLAKNGEDEGLRVEGNFAAPGGFGVVPDLVEILAVHVGRTHMRDVAVAESTGPAQGRRLATTNQNRRPTGTRRRGCELHRTKIEMTTFVADPLAGPELSQHRDSFVGARATFADRYARGFEFRWKLTPDTDAEAQPSAGKMIDRRSNFRGRRRMTQRQEVHAGAERHAFGHGGDVRKQRQGFENRHMERNMVADPDRIEAGTLEAARKAAHLAWLLGRQHRAHFDIFSQDQRISHAWRPSKELSLRIPQQRGDAPCRSTRSAGGESFPAHPAVARGWPCRSTRPRPWQRASFRIQKHRRVTDAACLARRNAVWEGSAVVEDLQRRFSVWVAHQMPEARDIHVEGLARIHGGASRETWRLVLQWSEDGQERRRPLILRRDPTGSLIETDRRVEFAAYRAFRNTEVPVPEALWLEPDPQWLDRPFFVMEQIEGFESSPQVMVSMPCADHARAYGQRKWSILGVIAQADPQALGLTEVLPMPEPADCWRRELDHWEAVLDDDERTPQPITRAVIRRLRHKPPPPARAIAVVHGDYRSGNFLFDKEGRIRAILDWEMAHLGDPLEDLAWSLNPVWEFARDGRSGGLLAREEAIGIWEEASGQRADKEALAWWELFACVKGQAIWVSAGREFLEGPNKDPVNALSAWAVGISQDRGALRLLGRSAL